MAKSKRYNRGLLRWAPSGRWQAEVTHQGLRRRKHFQSEARAKTWIDQTILEIDRTGRPLTSLQYEDARRAIEILGGSHSLVEAAKAMVDAASNGQSQMPLSDAIEIFLDDKRAAGARDRSLQTLKSQLGRLAVDLGDRPMSAITGPELLDWLDSHGYTGATRGNYRRDFVNLFNWCKRARLIRDNPAEVISRPMADDRLPEILSVEQTASLVCAAVDHDAELVVPIGLGAFAGVRQSEIARIEYGDITGDHIHVNARAAKQRRQRYVSIQGNLSAWLAEFGRRSGPVTPKNYRKRFEAVREASSIDPWPQNALRHSFATYYLALTHDAAATAYQLGQRSADVLYQHYRNLATEGEAADYFKITPGARS